MKHIEYSNKFQSSRILPKGVYSKDDCGKLTSKDSNNTRCSKQNTYHVANKNIAPSKVTNERRRKRGCLPGASPSLGFCHSLFHSPSNLYPKLENFTTQNSTGNLISSVSERKQNHYIRYCNELILYLFWC